MDRRKRSSSLPNPKAGNHMTVIQAAYDRFSAERFPTPDEAQVAELEQRIGVRFPDDYRRFLLGFNGGYFKEPEITPVGEGCPLDTLEILFGIGASHWEAELCTTATMGSFDDNSPPKIVPIGRTGMGGLIILDTAPGEGRGSIFLKKAFGDFYFLVEELEAFFALLREPTWA